MRALIYITTFLLLLTQGCKKQNPGACFNSSGKTETIYRSLDAFSKIYLYDNIDVELIQNGTEGIEITAGENLLPSIETDVVDQKLSIRNNNSCNWLRSYDDTPRVRVFFDQLDSLHFRSNGLLFNTDTIISDSLTLDIHDGGGSVKLIVKTAKMVSNQHHGTVDVQISGSSGLTFLYNDSYGPANFLDLRSQFLFMGHKGSNDLYVHAVVAIGATIDGIGNIYYTGNPSVERSGIGSGKVIKLNP